jgi:hypothetical protein
MYMAEAHLCKVKTRDAQVMHRSRGDWKASQPVLLVILMVLVLITALAAAMVATLVILTAAAMEADGGTGCGCVSGAHQGCHTSRHPVCPLLIGIGTKSCLHLCVPY